MERGQGNQAIQHARAALDLALAKNEKSQELICRQLYVESLMKAGRVPQAKQEFDTANAILLKANWPLLNLSYRITKARLDHLHGYSQKAQFDLETLVSELGLAGIWTYLLEAQLVRVQIARDLGQLEVAAGLQEWVGTCARDLGFSRQGKIALLGLSQP